VDHEAAAIFPSGSAGSAFQETMQIEKAGLVWHQRAKGCFEGTVQG